MGLLSQLGDTLSYEESKSEIPEVKKRGLIQFLRLYSKFYLKKLQNPPVIWGDEIEYHILNVDSLKKEIKLQCSADYIYERFDELYDQKPFTIQPEYGSWMIETTPASPFKYCCELKPVVENMKLRRKVISELLEKNDKLFSIPVFPLLGVNNYYSIEEDDLSSPFMSPNKKGIEKEEKNPFSKSIFTHDIIINKHPRFSTLTKNIRERRGEKVNIKIPLYIDEFTKIEKTEEEPYPGFIYLDSMAFGMGNCCLQTTFSTRDIDHARFFYDQMGIFAPYVLPLTAGSPIFKGKLADTDSRWQSIVQCVDDRTIEERDEKSEKFIPKSRYDSISFFISNDPRCLPEYNDLKFPVNHDAIRFLKENQEKFNVELDKNLLNHLGFLYLRDPLVIFKNREENDNSTKDFENIQSTNWNSVRFKPPPSLTSEINWRIEFRPMEIQLTDEENAIFSFLSLKILRMLSFDDFKLNFYIPMSYVDINFQRAIKKDAILKEKFFVRKNVFDDGKPEIIEITLFELFFGSNEFIGLEKISNDLFLDFFTKLHPESCSEYRQKCSLEISRIFSYIKDKTSGKKLTLAGWIRSFVQNHPLYKKDSIISQPIAFDLVMQMDLISNHQITDFNFTTLLTE